MHPLPAYFLTWTTYGTWLHGDPRGSVDDEHNQGQTAWLPPQPDRHRARRGSLKEDPFVLQPEARGVVHQTIVRVCEHRRWVLRAISVQSNHVHVVVHAPKHGPEQVIGQLKSWCTRDLREVELARDRDRLWTKMGSTRWINDERSLRAAIDYVLNHQ